MAREINKENLIGLTTEKKEILNGLMGSVVSPIDINKMMEEIEMENKNGITNDEYYKFLEMRKE